MKEYKKLHLVKNKLNFRTAEMTAISTLFHLLLTSALICVSAGQVDSASF